MCGRLVPAGVIARSLGAVALALTLVACGSSGTDTTSGADGGGPIIGPQGDGGGGGGGTSTLDCGGHGCGVKQLALGIIATCALLEDATVACYGGGIVGTLGRGDRPMIDPVPQRVPNLKNVAKVFAGGYSMCALLTDKTLACWGPDQSLGPYGARPGDFFAVQGLANVVDVAVATSHTCARVESGDLYCFGSNYFGELGDGTINNAKVPVKVASITGAQQIATGGEVSCAVLEGGSVSCWGMNDQGQLGQGTTDKETHPMPALVPNLGGPAKAIAASSASGAVCALLADGNTKCWGEKLTGSSATGGSALSVGGNHACVLQDGGSVSCWGANSKGQLGSGSNIASSAAVTVTGVSGAIGFSAGGYFSCAVFGDGSFSCWGDDSRGQLGSGKIGTLEPTPQKRHF